MDKMDWMQQMVEKNPQDFQTWYWLGQEWMHQGDAVSALSAFTEGLKYANDELRPHLIQAISDASQLLQEGGKRSIVTEPITEALASPANHPDPEINSDGNGYEDAIDAQDGQVASKVLHHPGLKIISGGKDSSPSPSTPSLVTFADVAGLKELKKTIQLKIISPFYNQGLFAKFRKKAGGGVLLYGPPGCGKTFIARATAGECKANFINVHITDILDPYLGVSESNLKDLFDKARYQKPSIMFFDEIDAIGFNRSKSSSHLRGLVDTFLSEMEGIDTNTEQVLIIGATNMPWDVDNALKRPGRFDRLIFVAPPDHEGREQIFRLKLHGRYIGSIDYARLAETTPFFSGADIENVCERAAETVVSEILETGMERSIEMRDLEEAVSQVHPSTIEWLRTVQNYVKYANQSGLYNDVEQYMKKHGKRI